VVVFISIVGNEIEIFSRSWAKLNDPLNCFITTWLILKHFSYLVQVLYYGKNMSVFCMNGSELQMVSLQELYGQYFDSIVAQFLDNGFLFDQNLLHELLMLILVTLDYLNQVLYNFVSQITFLA
jgi:hypothetical protein